MGKLHGDYRRPALRYVAFSNPYYISGIGVAVRPDSPLTKDDFEKADAKISVVYESTYSSWLEKHLGTDVYNRKIKDGSIVLVADHNGMVEKLPRVRLISLL